MKTKNKQITKSLVETLSVFRFNNLIMKQFNNEVGFTAIAFLTVLGLVLAISLALVGTGAVKLPWGAQIPVSPIPVSDPVEDDAACNDPSNADCEPFIYNDPEDLTPEQIQKALEEN